MSSTRNVEWGGGWYFTRILFSIVGIITIIPRFFMLDDLFSGSEMRFSYSFYSLGSIYEINSTEAFLCLSISVIGLLGVIYGKRFFHVGLILWFLGNGIFLTSEALNIKAYDRLLFFMGVVLLVSPACKTDLTDRNVSPYPRYLMMVIFSGLYLSTGLLKLLYEPGWFTGEALTYILNHRWHAGNSLALWLSTKWFTVLILGILIVLFELSAGILIWFKKINPFIILIGIFFHLGILILMNVGTFSLVVLAAYPVLLEPNSMEKMFKKSH